MAKDFIFDGAKMIEALGDVDLATKLIVLALGVLIGVLIFLAVCFVAFMKYGYAPLLEYKKHRLEYEHIEHSKKSKFNIND